MRIDLLPCICRVIVVLIAVSCFALCYSAGAQQNAHNEIAFSTNGDGVATSCETGGALTRSLQAPRRA